ncbi:MAG: MFS transporter [Chloroflexi bacterium]|nr:MFS transporter [Chloroflexota bacterium]
MIPQKPPPIHDSRFNSFVLAAARGFISLKVRNYRLFWTGQVISLIGIWMQTTAQAWIVLKLTSDSPFALGLVITLQFLPVMLFALFGGVLADRLPKRSALVVTQSLLMLQAAVFGVLVASGAIQLWHVYVLAVIQGLITAIDNPVRQAFIYEMVGRENLVNAIALNLDDVFFRSRAEQASRLRIHGKRQTERVVFLSEQAEQRVRAYLAMRPAAQDRALVLNRYGVHLSVTAVQKRLTHYAEQAGLHLTCYQLRHVFSRQLIEVGMPVTSLQALLGHRSLRTTQVYVHVADPLVRRDYFESMHRITGDEAANPDTLAQPGQNLAEASSSGTPRGGRSERRAA